MNYHLKLLFFTIRIDQFSEMGMRRPTRGMLTMGRGHKAIFLVSVLPSVVRTRTM